MIINVVAAVIKNKEGKILITKRNNKKAQGGLWEFPGGKVEKDETYEDALKREIREELKVQIKINEYIDEKICTYPEKEINLIAYEATILSGEIKLMEHEEYKWIEKDTIGQYEFAPADLFILEKIEINLK